MAHIINVTVEAFYDGQEADCTGFFDINLDDIATEKMKAWLVDNGMTYADFREMDFAFKVTVGRVVNTAAAKGEEGAGDGSI